ncbi:MAG: hypothetical protein OHK0031_12610 [Anaerolineales bacterium]
MKKIFFALLILFLLAACQPAATPLPATATPLPATPTASPSPVPPSATPTNPPPSATPAPSDTPAASLTPAATETATPAASAAPTETISEMLKTHIVFLLIAPEKGRTDACGDFRLEPIISQRYRTGDKVRDVQIALNMLFSVGRQYYGAYYNALWNTQFTINSYTYDPSVERMTIDFGGFFPVNQIPKCDKHGIREQIWRTFYYYGFKDKTFTYNGHFFIDQLSR